ncbi:MAG: DNA polymerase III subunit chi [Pseudomonadota bacterium]
MGKVMFYHLSRRPMEDTLQMLLGKALKAGWRVSVRGRDDPRMDWLDEKLWLGADDVFLPHGRSGGPHDALQPVLLTTNADRPNGATCVMSVDGADVSAIEINELDRVCVLFDGNDVDALQVARAQWKTLTAAGVEAEYWSEDGGRWEKKAQSGGRSTA